MVSYQGSPSSVTLEFKDFSTTTMYIPKDIPVSVVTVSKTDTET